MAWLATRPAGSSAVRRLSAPASRRTAARISSAGLAGGPAIRVVPTVTTPCGPGSAHAGDGRRAAGSLPGAASASTGTSSRAPLNRRAHARPAACGGAAGMRPAFVTAPVAMTTWAAETGAGPAAVSIVA
jgi:hypothetical protein